MRHRALADYQKLLEKILPQFLVNYMSPHTLQPRPYLPRIEGTNLGLGVGRRFSLDVLSAQRYVELIRFSRTRPTTYIICLICNNSSVAKSITLFSRSGKESTQKHVPNLGRHPGILPGTVPPPRKTIPVPLPRPSATKPN